MPPSPAHRSFPAVTATRLAAPAAGVLALLVYLLTMSRTFGVIDAGELAACAWTLGVAHPTGYPTLMALGFVLTHALPLPPILTLDLLVALCAALGVVALTFLYDLFLREAYPAPAAELEAGPRRRYAALAALFTGLCGAWWDQAVGFEVYALQALLLPLVCLFFLRWLAEERERAAAGARPHGITRRGALFAFGLGATFTNHLTTILLAPAFLTAWFLAGASATAAPRARRTARPPAPPVVARLAGLLPLAAPFLLGLVPPYAWLMLRAGQHPRFNWGDPSTPLALWRHVSGREFQLAMGHFLDAAFARQGAYVLHWLPGAVGYLGLVTGVGGLVGLGRRAPRLALWAALIGLASLLYACSYNVNDIANYLLGAVLALGLGSAAALAGLHRRFGPRVALPVALALVLAAAAANRPSNDQHDNHLTEDFAGNMLNSLPKDALVLTRQWDYWESGSLYLQAVAGVRPDVVVLDYDLLHTPWYLEQMRRACPAVFEPVRAETERTMALGARVGPGSRPDEAAVRDYLAAFDALVNALLERNAAAHPCFLTYDPFGPEVAPGYQRVPWQLAQRLTREPGYLPAEFPAWRFRMWRRYPVPQLVWTLKLYAEACQNRAVYEHTFGHEDAARRYATLALTFDPGFRAADIPDMPGTMEQQVTAELGLFARARENLARGIYQNWYVDY